MASCLYKIGDKEFFSESELNAYLLNNRDRFKAQAAGVNIPFSAEMNIQLEMEGKLRAMHASVDFDKVAHSYSVGGVPYSGTTEYVQSDREGGRWVPEFIEKNYRANVKANNPDITDADLDEIVKSWALTRQLGEDVHKMFEMLFLGKSDADIKSALDFTEDMEPWLEAVKKFRSDLQSKHGTGATFIPEMRVFSKDAKLAGTIDLVVIDAKGHVNIYDYKTSFKDPSEWSSAKDRAIMYQQAIYRNMLRATGVKVDSLNIVPIQFTKVNELSNKVESFEMGKLIDLEVDRRMGESSDVVMNVNKVIPTSFAANLSESKQVEEVSNIMEEMFGYNTTLKKKAQGVESFIKTRKKDENGKKYYWDKFEGVKKLIEDTPVEVLEEYLNKRYRDDDTLPKTLISALTTWMSQDIPDPSVWYNFSADNSRNIFDAVRKYFKDPDWMIPEEQTLVELGIVQIYNTRTNTVDLLNVTGKYLGDMHDMEFGTSIAGMFKKDFEVKDEKLLDASIANMEMIKSLVAFEQNKKDYKNINLGSIIVMNESSKPHTLDHETLKNNYKRVSKILGKKADVDWISRESALSSLKDYLQNLALGRLDKEITAKASEFDKAMNRQAKLEVLRSLQRKIRDKSGKADVHEYSEAYQDAAWLVTQAMFEVEGIHVPAQQDAPWFGNYIGENLNLSNPNDISKQTVKLAVQIVEKALNDVRYGFKSYLDKKRPKLKKLYAETGMDMSRRMIVGDTIAAYEDIIDKETMSVKDPANLTGARKEFAEFFIELINKERMRNPALAEFYQGNPAMQRQIPLLRASLVSKFKNKEYSAFYKDYFQDLVNPENAFESDMRFKSQQANKLEMADIFTYYEIPEKRAELLASEGLASFETDLELVLDMYMMTAQKRKHFDKALPMLDALKTATALSEMKFFQAMPNVERWLKDYIDKAVFNVALLEEESMGAAKAARLLTQLTSKLNLAFNPVSGLSEFLAGTWASIGRVMANSYLKDKFGFKEYTKAHGIMFSNGRNLVESENLVNELNELYGLANMDIPTMVQRTSSAKTGVLAFGSRHMYWFNAAPDYYNRMVMFMAQMMKDGTFEAHTMIDNDGVKIMMYDESKDSRFAKYFAGDDGTAEYKMSKALYDNLKSKLEDEEGGINEDGTLARAYSRQERNSMKKFADTVFGAYDHQDRIRWQNTVFGSMFMQFKTWLLAKKNRWYLDTDESGTMGKNEIVRGTRDAEGEFTADEEGDDYIVVWTGSIQEGIYQTLRNLFLEVHSSGWNFQESWKNLDENRKANVALMFSDLALLSILTGLTAAFDIEDVDDPFGRQLSRILINSGRDLWILNNIGAFASNKNPLASWGYATDSAASLSNALMGQDVGRNIFTTFGLTRPAYYMINAD